MASRPPGWGGVMDQAEEDVKQAVAVNAIVPSLWRGVHSPPQLSPLVHHLSELELMIHLEGAAHIYYCGYRDALAFPSLPCVTC